MPTGTAIVIGAGSGLGLAVARAFHGAGHPVALINRDRDRGREMVDQLGGGDADVPVRAFPADAGDPQGLAAAIRDAATDLGAPEVVVYNAGVVQPDAPVDLDLDTWNARLAVNLTGAKVATDTALGLLADGRGTLLFTGGGLALEPKAQLTSLSVGKAALRSYVQALFEDRREHGVHAATVTIFGTIGEPGYEPDAIAAHYLDLHSEAPGSWEWEVQVR